MTRLIIWANHHRRLSLFLIVICVCGSLPGLPKIELVPGFDLLKIDEDKAYEEIEEQYGSADVSSIIVHDKKLFSPSRLRLLKELVETIESKLSFSEKVESLFSVKTARAEDDSVLIEPLLTDIPLTQKQALILEERGGQSRVLRNKAISLDGDTTTIQIFLKKGLSEKEKSEFLDELHTILKPFKKKFDSVYNFGPTYLDSELTRYISGDIIISVIAAICSLTLVLTFMMHTFAGACFALVTGFITILIWAGLQAYLNIPITLISALIPSMAFAIGSTEGMHLLSSFLNQFNKDCEQSAKAVDSMAKEQGKPLLITSLTTVLGFASIMVHPLGILRFFGLSATIAFIITPLVTCLTAPLFFSFVAKFNPPNMKQDEKGLLVRFFQNIHLGLLSRHKVAVGALSFVLLMTCGFLTFHIERSEYGSKVFPADSEVAMRESEIDTRLPGTEITLLRLQTFEPDEFHRAENLRRVEKIQREIESYGTKAATLSVVDVISDIHNAFVGKEGDTIPANDSLISQYLMLVDFDDLTKLVDEDYSEVLIWIFGKRKPEKKYMKDNEAIRAIAKQYSATNWEITVSGKDIVQLKGMGTLAKGIVESIIIMLLCVFVILSVLFMNLKAGVIGVLVNGFPVVFCYSFLTIFDIDLTVSTALVATIAIGIAVDDTLHYMTHYHTELSNTGDNQKALEIALAREIRPILATSSALILFFLATATFTELSSSSHFGVINAMAIVGALIADLVLVPLLLAEVPLITLWDYISSSRVNLRVFESRVFLNMKKKHIRKIISLSKRGILEKGSVLCAQGEEASSIYILMRGSIRVSKSLEEGEEQLLGTFYAGETFGELALVAGGKRHANVTADQEIEFMEITRPTLDRIMRYSPWLGQRLLLNIGGVVGQRLLEVQENKA